MSARILLTRSRDNTSLDLSRITTFRRLRISENHQLATQQQQNQPRSRSEGRLPRYILSFPPKNWAFKTAAVAYASHEIGPQTIDIKAKVRGNENPNCFIGKQFVDSCSNILCGRLTRKITANRESQFRKIKTSIKQSNNLSQPCLVKFSLTWSVPTGNEDVSRPTVVRYIVNSNTSTNQTVTSLTTVFFV